MITRRASFLVALLLSHLQTTSTIPILIPKTQLYLLVDVGYGIANFLVAQNTTQLGLAKPIFSFTSTRHQCIATMAIQRRVRFDVHLQEAGGRKLRTISASQKNHHHNIRTIKVEAHESGAWGYISLRCCGGTIICYGTSSCGADSGCLSSWCHLASDRRTYPAGFVNIWRNSLADFPGPGLYSVDIPCNELSSLYAIIYMPAIM